MWWSIRLYGSYTYSIMISCETLGQNIGPHCWWGSWAFKHLTITFSAFTSSDCLQAMVYAWSISPRTSGAHIRAVVRGTAESGREESTHTVHSVLSVRELPTPVLLPGKSHGWRSPIGYSPWCRRVGHDWATSLSMDLEAKDTSAHGKGLVISWASSPVTDSEEKSCCFQMPFSYWESKWQGSVCVCVCVCVCVSVCVYVCLCLGDWI